MKEKTGLLKNKTSENKWSRMEYHEVI
jgi:hypothetical protein